MIKNLNGYTRALHLYIVDKSYIIWGTSQHNIFNILFSLSSEHLSSATKVMILSGDGSVFQAWMIMPCGVFHAYMILPRLLMISVCVMQTWYRLVYTWWRLCFMHKWYRLVYIHDGGCVSWIHDIASSINDCGVSCIHDKASPYLWCRCVSCIHDAASVIYDRSIFHVYAILRFQWKMVVCF